MRNYVIINGVNSLTIQGLAIKTMPPITKPIQRTLREEIDGRDGDIVTTLGYGAYDKTIEIGLFGTFDIDEVIAYFNQKGTITFSNEADKVYYFQALEQVDYAELLKFRTANVVLHCQPFKYPTEETPLEEEYEYVTGTGTDITLNNTEETEFNKIELQGNVYQDKSTILPSGYTLVEYIESTGNRYINTGYSLTSNHEKIEATFSYTDVATSSCPFGGKDNTSQSITPFGTTSVAVWCGESTSLLPQSVTANTIYNIIMEANNGTLTTNWNGTTNSTTYQGNLPNTPIGIFAQYRSGAVNFAKMRLYSFKLYDNGVLKRDYVPCIRNSDSAYGLYDLVTETFNGGLGSGNFLRGAKIYTPNQNDEREVHVVTGNNTITICGENILDDNILEQGYYPNNANPTIAGTTDARYRSFTMYLKAGTYTINFDKSPQITRAFTSYNYSAYNTLGVADTNKVNTFTTTQDGIVYFSFRKYDSTNWDATNDKVWLTNKTTGTNYQAYTGEDYPLNLSTMEMVRLEGTNYKDKFIRDNEGKWYKHAEIGKLILNGTNINWSNSTSTDTGLKAFWFLKASYSSLNIGDAYQKYCNYFDYRKQEWKSVESPCLCENSNLSTTMIIFSGFPSSYTSTDFNTWLRDHNTIIYYQLSTPTDTEITNETLIDQLEAIWNAISYRGQTNITQVSNDLPFMMEVSALKLGSDHLEINNTGNIYSKPTIELEGTGIVDIYLNDVQVFEVDLSEENKITIDTEKMEAYTDTGLANRKVTGDYSTFKLNVGTNDLRFSGALTSATITRYLRWL